MRSESYRLAVDAYIEDYPYGYKAGYDRRSASRQQREGYTGYRHQSHGHGDIFKYLEQEHGSESHYYKGSVQIQSVPYYPDESEQKSRIEENNEQAAYKAQLFYYH